MDNSSVAAEPHEAIDYSEAAGDVITDMPVAGPGDMPIERQTDTFHGFMSISRYAGAAIVLIVFWSTIIFGMDGSAFLTMLSTLGLGLALGAALKLRGWYYPVLFLSVLALWFLGWMGESWIDVDVPEPEEVVVDDSPF